jgi:NAD(P)-dependent dehydrogenase (short-subunit alcohol dehydrogenase family)
MELGLAGKVAVVTGANSGIGLAIVEGFVAEGASAVGGDLRTDALAALGDGVTPVDVDLTTPEGAERLVAEAVRVHGRVDVLVNNVGICPYREGFLQISDAEWMRVLDVNFFSMVRVTRAAIPHMLEQGGGSIVSIASEAGRQPDVFFLDYCVSKAAVLMLAKTIASEFGPHGIRSNCVSPGPTRTPLWTDPGGFAHSIAAAYGMDDPEQAMDHFARNVRCLPTGRLGRPEEVAAAVLFLASSQASQVTGSDYHVDGGIMRSA